MPTSDLKIAAAYIRVSTDDQEEYSPDSQVRLIREYARKNGYLLPEEYVFQDDGISAATARKRPAFNRMIALAKEKERPFDAILVLMFSRFARNREESVLYKGLLRKQGISVISVKEPAVDGPFGTLIESIIEWFDEYYLINLSAEVKRGMSEKFLRGEAMGTAPFGYRIDSANKTFTVDPERAEIVCDVFRSYADGAGLRDIAVQLGDAGITTRRGNRPDSRFVEYIEQSISDKKSLRKVVNDYRRTRPTIDAHKKLSGRKAENYRQSHEAEFIIYEAALRQLKVLAPGKKLPATSKLNTEIEALISEKNAAYNTYRTAKAEYEQLATAKRNAEQILHGTPSRQKKHEQER